jgi:hypothetical protein
LFAVDEFIPATLKKILGLIPGHSDKVMPGTYVIRVITVISLITAVYAAP